MMKTKKWTHETFIKNIKSKETNTSDYSYAMQGQYAFMILNVHRTQ